MIVKPLAMNIFVTHEKGLNIAVPENYFPDNDPKNSPLFNWGCSANLFYANWLNYCVYQRTPFDLNELRG